MATLTFTASAPPSPPPAPSPAPAREGRSGDIARAPLTDLHAFPPVAPALTPTRSEAERARLAGAEPHRPWIDDPDVQRLMREFPKGARVVFRGYHPTIWPRDWRRRAERAPWGLRPGDVLEVEGYGAATGFPEALLCRRLTDGVRAMVFFPEVMRQELPAAGAASSVGPNDAGAGLAPGDSSREDGGQPAPPAAEPAIEAAPAPVSNEVEEPDPVIVASEESFPASDPPAWVPARVAALAGAGTL